jgi:hypothetical protein
VEQLRPGGLRFGQGRLYIIFDGVFKTAAHVDQRIALNRQIEVEAKRFPFLRTAVRHADKDRFVAFHIVIVHVHSETMSNKTTYGPAVMNGQLTESGCESPVYRRHLFLPQ